MSTSSFLKSMTNNILRLLCIFFFLNYSTVSSCSSNHTEATGGIVHSISTTVPFQEVFSLFMEVSPPTNILASLQLVFRPVENIFCLVIFVCIFISSWHQTCFSTTTLFNHKAQNRITVYNYKDQTEAVTVHGRHGTTYGWNLHKPEAGFTFWC